MASFVDQVHSFLHHFKFYPQMSRHGDRGKHDQEQKENYTLELQSHFAILITAWIELKW